MGPTSAEKQRRYRERINADPEKREEYLRKMRERAHNRRITKIDKQIGDLSERSKIKQRKEWRDRKRRSRANSIKRPRNLEAVLDETAPSPLPQVTNAEHHNTIRGRQKVRRDRSASYRRVKQLEKELVDAKKKINKYKRRVSRLKKTKINNEIVRSISPLTKLNIEVRDQVIPEPIKRKLLFQDTILAQVRETYKMSLNEKTKQSLASVCKGKYIRKYRFVKKAKNELGAWANDKKKKLDRSHAYKLCTTIKHFYCRDDNSIQTPGKKQTITYRGIKKQKRLLLYNLRALHDKFCKEFNSTVSLATFCRRRPFWVVRAKLTDRDSCLCKRHDNLQKMLATLVKEKVTTERNLELLCDVVCCNTESLLCMTNGCKTCQDKNAIDAKEVAHDKVVRWFAWKTTKEEFEKNGKKIQVRKTVKAVAEGKLGELIQTFNKDIKQVLCPHVFRIRHQFQQSRKCKNELCYEEAAVHMDFSENYSCKLNSEIQAMHFGASHNQVTLHTVVVYFETNEKKMFCTISGSRRHDPSAIWAHLTPILLELRDRNIEVIHFFSDGPSSQYKNKGNILFFKTYFHEMGFKYGTWNYSEASHGKGAPDGLGAAIKRISDNLVSKGQDIDNARTLFEKVKDKTSITTYFIEESKIEQMDQRKTNNCESKKIPGIFNTHQIISLEKENYVYTRKYSCFCKKLPVIDHDCFNLQKIPAIKENSITVSHSCKNNDLPLDQWVLVSYDNSTFSGLITDTEDENYEVNALKKIGENKYVWPKVIDKIWYNKKNILATIAVPQQATKRILVLKPDDWKAAKSTQMIV
ncbi:unnamed protein product [Brassicogethes aeneus]|uniref:Uncharacterized protein n=1 Tax=Brassicogethes aeneus TaxID=1431903 RepID=A0A9P0BCE4_BRAAE|nr:unnamed protein product [Brassicogethes aeneus]